MNEKEIEAYLTNRGLTPEWITDSEHGVSYPQVHFGRLGIRFVQSYIACGSVGVTTHFPQERVEKAVNLLEKAASLHAPVFIYSLKPSLRTGRMEGDLPHEGYPYPMNELEDYADVLEYNPRKMRLEELTLGGRIRYARLAKGISAQQLAEASGVREEDVAQWETGALMPDIASQQLAAVLGALDMDPDDLDG